MYRRTADINAGFSALAEPEPVTERVADFQGFPPTLLDDVRAGIAVLLADQLIAQLLDILRRDEHRRTWTGVTVMLGEVQVQPVTADAQIQRQIRFEAVLELDAETEKVDVKLTRFAFIEDPQDRDGAGEGHGGWLGRGHGYSFI